MFKVQMGWPSYPVNGSTNIAQQGIGFYEHFQPLFICGNFCKRYNLSTHTKVMEATCGLKGRDRSFWVNSGNPKVLRDSEWQVSTLQNTEGLALAKCATRKWLAVSTWALADFSVFDPNTSLVYFLMEYQNNNFLQKSASVTPSNLWNMESDFQVEKTRLTALK